MSLRQRRILYIFFIFLFLIITPAVSLYANGYKLGGGFSIQKTGILILDSDPENAKIYLNDKIQQRFFKKIYAKEKSYINTPAKIKNLIPGEYNVRIELEKYWPWEKKLTVNSGQSTFAEDIRLFKKELPILLHKDEINTLKFTPDNKNLIALSSNQATIINTSQKKIISFDFSETQSSTQAPLILSQNKQTIINDYIFNLSDWKNPFNLNKIIGPAKIIKWDNSNSSHVYYLSPSGIKRFDIKAKINKSIINELNISDFLIKNETAYYISKINQFSELYVWELDTDNRFQENTKLLKQIKLPFSNYKFINPEHKLINLYDENFNILYLIDPLSPLKPLRETITNVRQAYWATPNKLLYANDFEIWLFDLNNYQKTLLTRISEKINTLIWHPSDNYIVYATDQYINIIELDNREKYNITNLINLDSIKALALNKAGDTLYFYANIGSQAGVYKLFIQ